VTNDVVMIVEVAPIYDNPGETTVLAAAEIVLSLIRLMVKKAAVVA
jgi:agmatinase